MKSLFATSFKRMLPWIVVVLAFLLLSACDCCDDEKKQALVYDPAPAFHLSDDVFLGGRVTVIDENQNYEAIDYVDLTFFNGHNWVIIDRDWGEVMDSNEKAPEFNFYWDIRHLEPGSYLLRAQMYGTGGGYEEVRKEVTVAMPPQGRVQIAEVSQQVVVFSAQEFNDPYNTQFRHHWMFDWGQQFENDLVIIPELQERVPMVFTHTVTNELGASFSNTYLFVNGFLFSLVDKGISVNLGSWAQKLLEIVKEKDALKAKLNDANKRRIDDANAKLKEAAKKLEEARKLLNQKPPNQVDAKRLIKEAMDLINEAKAILGQVDQEKATIDANIDMLNNLVQHVGVTLLETDYLIDRINDLADIIKEKKGIKGLNAANAKVLKEVITLLEAAEKLLNEAKAELLKSPPGIKNAKEKIDEARKKIREAGAKFEAVKPPVKQFTANLERFKVLYLKLGMLSGKLWLLEEISLSNPHADIPIPDLTRDQYPCYKPWNEDVQMGRPPGNTMDDNGWDDAVLYHELDHHFLQKKNNQNMPGGSHWYDEDLGKTYGKDKGRKLAWSEGWANFSSCAKRKDPHYLDENEDNQPANEHFTIEKDLENDRCKNTGEKKMHPNKNKGPAVEGSVSGILWDLFDGAATGTKDQDNDGVSIEFIRIWEAINLKPYPEDIIGFYKNIVKVLDSKGVNYDKDKLKDIFKNHGVDVK